MIAREVSRARSNRMTHQKGVGAERIQDNVQRDIKFIDNDEFGGLRISRDEIRGLVEYHPDEKPTGRQSLPGHLEQMCSAPLLSAKEERSLFRAMNYLKYRAEMLRSSLHPSRPSKKKLNEINEALSLAKAVRNRIINSNTRLVISIVKKFNDSYCSFDDLLSEGISCLMHAVEKFDYARGFRFSTYATSAVRRDLFRLVQRRHRDLTRFSTGAGELLDQSLAEPENPARTESVLSAVDEGIHGLMRQLDDREQFIVRARYGFIDLGEKPTFQRLGRELGVSKERVRQLEIRAVDKLHQMAAGTGLEGLLG